MEDEIRFCPNCGSVDVEPDTSNAAYMGEAGGNPNKWKCNDCGYTGLMPEGNPDEDLEEDLEEMEFDPEEEYPREDTGFGKAYLKYILYILLPVAVIYLLITQL